MYDSEALICNCSDVALQINIVVCVWKSVYVFALVNNHMNSHITTVSLVNSGQIQDFSSTRYMSHLLFMHVYSEWLGMKASKRQMHRRCIHDRNTCCNLNLIVKYIRCEIWHESFRMLNRLNKPLINVCKFSEEGLHLPYSLHQYQHGSII